MTNSKTILVTGATDGIGKAAATELARRGAHVILHGRSLEKLKQTQDEIQRLAPDAKLDSAPADLSSLTHVRAMAREVASRFSRLDVLLHNAGVFMKQRELTEEGYEKTFTVNHLAPFLLTLELLPLLRASRARIVTVSSVAHNRGRIDFNNLNAESRFDGYTAYAQSKLANILFANELAEQESGRLTSNSLHPGVITTKLLKTGFNSTGVSVEEGAATSIYLADSPEVEGVTGKYFSNRLETAVAPHALDKATQKQLWAKSLEMIRAVQ